MISYFVDAFWTHPLSICWPDQQVYDMMESEKEEVEDWPDDFKICSIEEAEVQARAILRKGAETEWVNREIGSEEVSL